MKATSRFLAIAMGALLESAAVRAQVAGHDTVPTNGPAARERHDRTAEDPVLIQVERIRQDLASFGKRYRKTKGTERESLERPARAALEEIQARVRALQDSVGAR